MNTKTINTNNFELDLSLIYKERTGDILFLIGTLLAIISTYQAVQSTIGKYFFRSSKNDSAFTIATASWLFFAASIIFAYVAVIRYEEVAAIDPYISSSTLLGGKFTAIGNTVKVIGFGLSAIGNQIKANSTTPSGPTIISQ
ncbi:hypothetical protein [Dehalobacter sp.]|jgi:hypothetical protein|uniref:hypothetical protein n=1 Tax=Dehalobacter sp. TaxID=1962289 RepID=UPI00030D2218|nr:hypothetical protein [Dehalobacter sp.]MCG1025402.1 hypothetical protein [Dehalobacter sp.]